MKYWRKPLGQSQPKSDSYQVQILDERCKGCRFCIEFCPKKVLHESREFNAKGYYPARAEDCKDCLDCGLCELICPEFAIHVSPVEEKSHE